MPLQIENKTFARVSIVDDDSKARGSYEFSVEDLGLTAVNEDGPLDNLQRFLKELPARADAVLCDLHLRKKGHYADFDGDALVAACYRDSFPAVLCTSYADIDIFVMRSLRRFIPVLLKPRELNPDNIAKGLERCLQEFDGHFQPSRRPWRTLVRVEEVEAESEYFYVIISGWSSREKIRITFDDLPNRFRPLIKPQKRFHAQVNVGAESADDLYFDSWEAD